jgi:hypothetical protein
MSVPPPPCVRRGRILQAGAGSDSILRFLRKA